MLNGIFLEIEMRLSFQIIVKIRFNVSRISISHWLLSQSIAIARIDNWLHWQLQKFTEIVLLEYPVNITRSCETSKTDSATTCNRFFEQWLAKLNNILPMRLVRSSLFLHILIAISYRLYSMLLRFDQKA